MGFAIGELRRRLKRRLRNRQSVSRYCRRLGPLSGLMTYLRLVAYHRRAVPVAIPGLRGAILVRPDTTDPFIFEEVFILDEYDFETAAHPEVIFDIGANVGYAAVYFAQRYPEARIIAVEPEKSNLECLKRNTAAYPNITIVEAGIWGKRTRLTLVDPDAKSSDFQLRESRPGEDGIEALTVDNLLELANTDHVDIVKIDIEGGEKELFAENVDWLARVGTLIIELHDRFKPGCKETFLDAVSRYGFSGHEMGLNYIVRRQGAG